MSTASIPVYIDDEMNATILSVSEDRVEGFNRDPFGEISRLSGVPLDSVLERIRAMLEAGIIRRVRQTLLATNLAHGCLAAWQVPAERLTEAFDTMYSDDPFSGHVVIRSTDNATAGSSYRLWTTLKVPTGYSLEKHARFLADRVGAEHFLLMPARRLFALGVGHVRRKQIAIGSMSVERAEALQPEIVELSALDWQVLTALKRELAPDEVRTDLWKLRAAEAQVTFEKFCSVAESLADRHVIGRFSTFLEHVKPTTGDQRVTRYNALFHWAVEPGREIDAGCEIGRFHIMTHAYWREGGPELKNVNIMGVAHGLDRDVLLQHKAAMDTHLADVGIPVHYTNVFWGGRSEIKPSEISPVAYREFCIANGLDPHAMAESS